MGYSNKSSRFACFTGIFAAIMCMMLLAGGILTGIAAFLPKAQATDFTVIVLSKRSAQLEVGSSFYLTAFALGSDNITFKSSSSGIASVDSSGLVTAKKAGTATITAKAGKASATCKVKVKNAEVTLSKTSISMENGTETRLIPWVSSGTSDITWKSSKRSVATVDSDGTITAVKPGTATITATADGGKATCKVTVKSPTVTLSKTKLTLTRGKTAKLTAKISSNSDVSWKSNKTSVAIVDSDGTVTAMGHGQASITCSVDGVNKVCTVIVEQPSITLSDNTLKLAPGDTWTLKANVSNGNTPIWSSSNYSVADVNSYGKVTAGEPGKAYIYCEEDGVKKKCTVTVTEGNEKSE